MLVFQILSYQMRKRNSLRLSQESNGLNMAMLWPCWNCRLPKVWKWIVEMLDSKGIEHFWFCIYLTIPKVNLLLHKRYYRQLLFLANTRLGKHDLKSSLLPLEFLLILESWKISSHLDQDICRKAHWNWAHLFQVLLNMLIHLHYNQKIEMTQKLTVHYPLLRYDDEFFVVNQSFLDY